MLVKKAGMLIAVTLAVILVSYTQAVAQLGTSAIKGTVYDSTDAVVGGATITIKNKLTGQIRQTVSSEEGFFSMQNLQPGDFTIEIQANGFTKLHSENISMHVGETIVFKGKLKPSDTQAVIDVNSGEISIVNTSNAQIAGFISEKALANLPLNGRNFLDLGLLLPGNTSAPIFSPTKSFLSQASSLGQSARGNNVSVDGADNNDDVIGGLLQNVPIDGVREFQIQLAQYGAESGRSASSIINIITKSGSNKFHGSGVFFFRNNKLSGLPPTLDRSKLGVLGNPSFDREQYAFTLGGPIKQNRANFFNAFEYRNQDAVIITGQRDTLNKVINTIYAPSPLRDLLLTSRVDLNVSNNDHMFFRYGLQQENNIDLGRTSRPISTPNFRIKIFNESQSLVYNWVHIFSPKLLNDFTLNETYYKNRVPVFSGAPFEVRFPSIQDGSSVDSPQSGSQNRLQLRNIITLILGSHITKFGGELHFLNTKSFDGSFSGGAVFTTENFASRDRNRDGKVDDNDIPISLAGRITSPFSVRTIDNNNNKYLVLFVQDDWKVKPNFTLNLGLRYELDTNVGARNDFKILTPLVTQRTRIDNNNFAPRIGFNWSPFKDNKTSIHGGYGIFYSRTLLNLANTARGSASGVTFDIRRGSVLDSMGNFVPGTPTLTENTFSGEVINNISNDITVFDPRLATPYTQQFSLGIEHELPYNIIVSADALHSYGLKFIQTQLINENPIIFASVSALKNWNDSLLVKVERRSSKNFNFLAAYTLAKSLTMSQDFQDITKNDNLDVSIDKGPPPNDIRHRFSFSGIYNAPLGINISSIFTLESGIPINIRLQDGSRLPLAQVNAGGRQFKTGTELNAFIKQINMNGGVDGVPLPFVADKLKLGDSLVSLDLRVNKEFKLRDNITIQGIAEVFNVFNVTNVRGSGVNNFSGFQNVLVRDSSIPTNPGFLQSSSFGRNIQNAGGVFGTGGPRAFQFALRISF